ncbi:MAG: beta-glycosidase [Bacteroidales bacterium]|nr:beta-glycosidase [Bacteroidales bacterium]
MIYCYSKSLLILFILFVILAGSPKAFSQAESQSINLPGVGEQFNLHSGWYIRKASDVKKEGTELTSSVVELKGWMPAKVPGTVLSTLLKNGVYPNPYYAANNDSIPDIYYTGNEFYTYWFVNAFKTNQIEKGRYYQLNFRGINYKARVFLNGKELTATPHEGMFLRFSFDITSLLRNSENENVLAVLVFPPDPPGKPNGGQGGDGQIGKSVTNQYTAGWDWISPVRDRNTGIWDEVSVTSTGPVTIAEPYVNTRVPGVRVPGQKQDAVYETVETAVTNKSGKPQSGTLFCRLNNLEFSKKVKLAAGESKAIVFQELPIQNPELWWPNGIGNQPLYKLTLEFKTVDGNTSDSRSDKIGLRRISSVYDTNTRSRLFSVNGQKLFIRGGNWIATDWMLATPTERYDQEVRLHKEMNLNMIRIWGGATTERPEFYSACDKYGILVMQDLWITGDCNGAWHDSLKTDNRAARRKYPDDHELFIKSAIDQIKMIRNHPSLLFWCGGNEFRPPLDIDSILQHYVFPTYDPNRLYVNSSFSRDLTMKYPDKAGDGPYGIMEPEWFYFPQENPFNPEMGSVGLPEIESLRKILPENEWVPPVDVTKLPNWTYHKYLAYGDHIDRYGKYNTLEEFSRQAQLVNYLQYKSFIEGLTSNMYKTYTGVAIWRTQNPWTALGGQMYDWFLAQNGCFYGLKHACEAIHIQLNLDDSTFAVVNTTPLPYSGCSYAITYFDREGRVISELSGNLDIKKQSVTEFVKNKTPDISSNLYFISLKLLDSRKKIISENFYWMNHSGKDFSELKNLPEQLPEISSSLESIENSNRINITLNNPGHGISFFNRISIKSSETSERILPAYYSDNYISLLPNEKKVITVEFKSSETDITLEVMGWNGKTKAIKIERQ